VRGRGGRVATTRAKRVEVSTQGEVSRSLQDIEAVIFDCDGVIWRGMTAIAGAAEAIRGLERKGKRVMYLTNNSTKSREQCAAKLGHFDVKADKSQVICSSSSAARYLDSIGFDRESLKVLVVGQEGITIELQEAGYEVVPCSEATPSSEAKCTIGEFEEITIDEKVGALVVGVDDSFSYSKLCVASLYLSQVEGCVFVATNRDVGDRVGDDGRRIPGAGPVVAAVETASGRKATNVGKGGSWLLPHLLETMQLDAGKTCIVGDRIDTDIALGKESGMLTILPLTGVTDEADLEACPEESYPDLVVESIATLL